MILGQPSKVGQDASASDLLRAAHPWPVTGEVHTWAVQEGSLLLYLLWLKRCHQGNKALLRGDRSPHVALQSPFSVASRYCYLAPDIYLKVTFGEEIVVDKFQARAVWFC